MDIPTIDIEGLTFFPLSDKHIKETSVCEVKHHDTGSNSNIENSVASNYMGSNTDMKECATCLQVKKDCYGHSGHLNLNTTCINNSFIKQIIKYLKVICFKCGGIVVKYNENSTLSTLLSSVNSKIKKGLTCENIIDENTVCGEPHPAVHENINENKGNIMQEKLIYSLEKKKTETASYEDLLPDQIYEIFSRIPTNLYKYLDIKEGKEDLLAPMNLLNKTFYVPPNILRPNQYSATGKAPKNSLNASINSILKASQNLGDRSTGMKSNSNAKEIKDLNRLINAMKKPMDSGATKDTNIYSLLSSKAGWIRSIVLGARLKRIMRCFITGDPRAKLDEVFVSQNMAMKIQIEEIVTEFNIEKLTQYLLNGSEIYPRCISVWKARDKSFYYTHINKNLVLEPNDKIYRDLTDGDVFIFCRQPTLMLSNMTAMYARVRKDVKTFSFNPNITPLFNADYDGDEMNGYCAFEAASFFEIKSFASIEQLIISNGYGSPLIGQIQDGLLGLVMLTRDNVNFNLENACRLFNNTGLFPVFPKSKIITGRNILTVLFNHLNIIINYKGTATYYKPELNPYRKYSETEINVEIKNGEFISGIIDKKTVGSKAYNGLYHRIYQKYGPQTTMQIIWYMQQIANNYITIHGYTCHRDDFKLTREQFDKIKENENSIIAESMNYAENLRLGNIYPPVGKTLREFYESEQIKILSNNTLYSENIHKGIDYENNNMYLMSQAGVKGSTANLSDMLISCGQVIVHDKRLPDILDGRASHLFHRDSNDPRSKGFVTNSYYSGLSLSDLLNLSYSHRIGLIVKAMGTADTGTKYRESISSLESLITGWLFETKKGQNIRQLIYGGCGMDPRATCKVQFKFNVYKKCVEGEEKRLIKVNNFFASMLMQQQFRTDEKINTILYIPVNIHQIIDDINNSEPEKDKATIKDKYQFVVAFIKTMPKFYFNKNYEGTIPVYYKSAVKLFRYYLYNELRSEIIDNYSMRQIKIITELIESHFINNLENAGTCVGIRSSQAISEPNTQQMLDSIHGKATNKIVNFKNIMSAITPEKITNPAMEIYFNRGITREQIEEFADKIEMLKFKYFISKYEIFYETYNKIRYNKYKDESKMLKETAETYTLPSDLLNWCVRIEFNLFRMISKDVKMEDIYIILIKLYPALYISFNTLNSDNPIMRIYFKQSILNKFNMNNSFDVEYAMNEVIETIIRGIDGIHLTEVNKKKIPSQTIGETEDIYYILTEGSNLDAILNIDIVNKELTKSNCIKEMEKYWGKSVAYSNIIDGLRLSVKDAQITHYTIFASEMCAIWYTTALNRFGSHQRGSGTCQLIADASPVHFVQIAASRGTTDKKISPNSATIMGSIPDNVGTNINIVCVNEEFIEQQTEKKIKELEDI